MQTPIEISKNHIINNHIISIPLTFSTIPTIEKLECNIMQCGNTNCKSPLINSKKCVICQQQTNATDVPLTNHSVQIILDDNKTKEPESITVFAIDCSGSMDEENRLLSMKSLLLHYVENNGYEHPNERLCIILFDTDVTIYGDGTFEPIRIPSYSTIDEIVKLVEKVPEIKKMNECKDQLNKVIKNIQPSGLTCGVSALFASTLIAARYGGKVFFCTDGSSNRGIALDGTNLNMIMEKAQEGGVSINCYSFGDCATFIEPYEVFETKKLGSIHKLKGTIDVEKSNEAFIPSLKSETFGKNGTMKVHVPAFVELVDGNKQYPVLNDLIEDTVELKIIDADQMKRNSEVTVLITIGYTDSCGRFVMFVLEKIIKISNILNDEGMSVFKYELAAKMKETFLEKKNYNEALAVINEYKLMKLELSHDNHETFETIIGYFADTAEEMKDVDEDELEEKEKIIKDFIETSLLKQTGGSNYLKQGN